MRGLFPRFWRSLYRPDPLASFLLILGGVDAVIGSTSDRWGLFGLGASTVFIALVLRWWHSQALPRRSPHPQPRAYLPPASSPPPLPLLSREPQQRFPS